MTYKRVYKGLAISQGRILALALLFSYPLFKWQANVLFNALRQPVFYVSAMRQLGKTHLAIFYILILCLAGYTGIYSAHRRDTVDSVAAVFIKLSPMLYAMRLIETPWKSNQRTFHFTSGGSVKFRTRTGGLG